MKQFSIFFLLLISSGAFANEVWQTYNVPQLGGLWVDTCVMRYGNIDCSDQATGEAAGHFCQIQHGTGLASGAKAGPVGGFHETRRWTLWIQNGQQNAGFEECYGCSGHFQQLNCQFIF